MPGSPAVDSGAIIAPYTNGYVGAAPDVGALELGLAVFVSGVNTALIPKDLSPVFASGKSELELQSPDWLFAFHTLAARNQRERADQEIGVPRKYL